ncbi:MAG: hypothetical protein H7X93_14730 [Sphingomonadaceae bacterium]|nr:hypothetical protein [Sphingomonadaceae bacterium]
MSMHERWPSGPWEWDEKTRESVDSAPERYAGNHFCEFWISNETREIWERTGIRYPLGSAVQTALGRITTEFLVEDFETQVGADESIVSLFGLVDDHRTLDTALSISASAKYGGGGFGGSATASLSKSYSHSRRSVSLAFTKVVRIGKEYALRPQWNEDAMGFWGAQSKNRFYQRYGDHFVHSLIYGGMLSLVLQIDFSTAEAAEEFHLSAGGSYGGGSGSVDILFTKIETSSKANVQLYGHVSGVNEFPDVEYNVKDPAGIIRKQDINGSLLQSLIDYYNEFEEKVYERPERTVTAIETRHIDHCSGAPGDAIDITEVSKMYWGKLNELEGCRAEVEAVQADAEYIVEVGYSWNPADVKGEAKELSYEALRLLETIDEEGRSFIEDYDKELNLPVVPHLPAFWFVTLPPVRTQKSLHFGSDEVGWLAAGLADSPRVVVIELIFSGRQHYHQPARDVDLEIVGANYESEAEDVKNSKRVKISGTKTVTLMQPIDKEEGYDLAIVRATIRGSLADPKLTISIRY